MATAPPTCVGFDAAGLAGTYSAPVLNLEGDVRVTVNTAPWMATIDSPATYAKVSPVAFAGWTENAIALSNVYLVFTFGNGKSLELLSFRFHDASSRLYIELNHEFLEPSSFSGLSGTTLGGVDITVTPGPDVPTEGTVELTGLIEHRVVIGSGEMLWIDDVCFQSKPT